LRRGLLLPQVAVEWKWDRTRFLEETCLKAGLPPDAWRHGSRIQTFTAQVFEEQEPIARTLTRTG
jgi:AMMECR1 domain-containing protein